MKHYVFNKNEEVLKAKLYQPFPYAYGMGTIQIPKYNTPITCKENFSRFMNQESIAWMPCMMTDFNFIQPMVMPDAKARAHGGLDWFGIEWEFEPICGAAMVKPGTRRLSDITAWREELTFPDLDAIDWQKDYEENYAPYYDKDRPTCFVIVNGLFERTADLTSFEDAFCYLLEEPEELTAFYEKLTDWHIHLLEIARKYYHADLITFHDDMGSQQAPFMSRECFSELLMPHYKRITDAAHQLGMWINFHSCGHVDDMLDLFCDCGFDMWEGQNNAVNTSVLLEKYGNRIAFLNAFKASPDMTDEAYYQKIADLVNTYGPSNRVMFWLQDQSKEHDSRSFWDDEAIYCLSREFYNK